MLCLPRILATGTTGIQIGENKMNFHHEFKAVLVNCGRGIDLYTGALS